MKVDDQFESSGLLEVQFERGSHGQVLKNRLGITLKQQMNRVETKALAKALDLLIRKFDETHRVTAADLCECHRIRLGENYEWAGHYRQVDISKENFLFAAAAHIPSLMEQFEQDVLGSWTPCRFPTRADITLALAETHVELVLIHPFRDGNGRLARGLASLMALQAGLPLLDFSVLLSGEKGTAYLTAIQAGRDTRYAPMQKLFEEIIDRSLPAL